MQWAYLHILHGYKQEQKFTFRTPQFCYYALILAHKHNEALLYLSSPKKNPLFDHLLNFCEPILEVQSSFWRVSSSLS